MNYVLIVVGLVHTIPSTPHLPGYSVHCVCTKICTKIKHQRKAILGSSYAWWDEFIFINAISTTLNSTYMPVFRRKGS